MSETDSIASGTEQSPVAAIETDPVADGADAVADGVWHQLDPRYVAMRRKVNWLSALATAFISAIALITALAALDEPRWASRAAWWLWLAWTAANAWRAHQWPAVQYRHASYKVDDQGLEIRRGVIWRQFSSVPRSRVQHTDVSQGPFERGHGLATLIVHTAGTIHAQTALHGLEHARAMLIREHLLPRESGDAV